MRYLCRLAKNSLQSRAPQDARLQLARPYRLPQCTAVYSKKPASGQPGCVFEPCKFDYDITSSCSSN